MSIQIAYLDQIKAALDRELSRLGDNQLTYRVTKANFALIHGELVLCTDLDGEALLTVLDHLREGDALGIWLPRLISLYRDAHHEGRLSEI